MADTFQNEVARARAAEQARLDNGWALLHQATERCRLLDWRAAERREQVRKEAEEIRVSTADEAEEVLAGARASAREILARAHHEAMEIISAARQRIPSTIGPPNPALAGEEAKRAAQHLLDQARTNADGLLANARQRLEEAEDREALLHAREESADSRAESLSLQEVGIAVREAKVRDRKQELCLSEEQLPPSRTGSTGSGRPLRAGRRWSTRPTPTWPSAMRCCSCTSPPSRTEWTAC
jgi:cell division septum initiation protein DivIVA